LVAAALASIAATLAKMAMDVCLYNSQNFAFLAFPDELTTGSSIMPHKKNPDVFELIRSKCNKIKALPNEIFMMTTNLPSGYHRDLQLIKENFLPAFNDLNDCLNIAHYMFENIIIKTGVVEEDKYKYMFSVERVNELVLSGVPFRDAYKQVGAEIDTNAFKANTNIQHSHEGSIGNLCNDYITKAMNEVLVSYNFATKHKAYKDLLNA